jgi:hypothetical protein
MRSLVMSCLLMIGMLFAAIALAGDSELAIETASGMVEKVEKGSVMVQTREAGGKFGKKLVLKLTGTSKLTQVSQEKRGGKLVTVQREADPKDLESRQAIAIIYATGGEDNVLLSAVIQRATAK